LQTVCLDCIIDALIDRIDRRHAFRSLSTHLTGSEVVCALPNRLKERPDDLDAATAKVLLALINNFINSTVYSVESKHPTDLAHQN
jgi:hypothetical protein